MENIEARKATAGYLWKSRLTPNETAEASPPTRRGSLTTACVRGISPFLAEVVWSLCVLEAQEGTFEDQGFRWEYGQAAGALSDAFERASEPTP